LHFWLAKPRAGGKPNKETNKRNEIMERAERILFTLLSSFIALLLVFMMSSLSWAGCGCDHPTPCPTPIMPGFASPGDPIKLTEMDFILDEEGYEVEFKKGKMAKKKRNYSPPSQRLNAAPTISGARFSRIFS